MYLVSPKGGEYLGRKIYRDPKDLPETPELAVILTPAATVPGLLKACADRGITRVIIETGRLFRAFRGAGGPGARAGQNRR